MSDKDMPAFPCEERKEREENGSYWMEYVSHNGMTLRDWFAGMALQGILANPGCNRTFTGRADIAETAYKTATAMMEARDND